jgi:hypothetical protein
MVACAIYGAIIAARWVEGGVLAFLLGLIGAVIGAIIAAPGGVLLGWIIGLIVSFFTDLLTERADWGTRIGSFFASPNPLTAGNSMTLTARKITPANSRASIAEVAFYALDNFGTQASSGIWTLNLTSVTLAPGSYTLHARARDSGGAFGVSRQLTLAVQ